MWRRHSLYFSALILATALTGCTVSPTALTDAELSASVAANTADVAADQEPVSGPVSLYEAMARSLKFNLDHRVEEAEAAVRM